MANICIYKIKAIGRKSACLALVNMLPAYSREKEYTITGNAQKATLLLTCDCKWFVDYQTQSWKNPKKFSDELISTITDGDFWDMPLRDKSIVLNLDISCNQKDIDDNKSKFQHFKKGEFIPDSCPKELNIRKGKDY